MVCSLQANLPSRSVDLSKLGLFRGDIPLLSAQPLLLRELCKGDSDILGRPIVIPRQLLLIVLDLLLVSGVTLDLVLDDPEDGEDHEETGENEADDEADSEHALVVSRLADNSSVVDEPISVVLGARLSLVSIVKLTASKNLLSLGNSVQELAQRKQGKRSHVKFPIYFNL